MATDNTTCSDFATGMKEIFVDEQTNPSVDATAVELVFYRNGSYFVRTYDVSASDWVNGQVTITDSNEDTSNTMQLQAIYVTSGSSTSPKISVDASGNVTGTCIAKKTGITEDINPNTQFTLQITMYVGIIEETGATTNSTCETNWREAFTEGQMEMSYWPSKAVLKNSGSELAQTTTLTKTYEDYDGDSENEIVLKTTFTPSSDLTADAIVYKYLDSNTTSYEHCMEYNFGSTTFTGGVENSVTVYLDIQT